MEIEFFCPPDDARTWYEFWCEVRKNWWQALGLTGENIQMRQHDSDELAHYAKEGCGTFDVEYRFPFTYPGYGELEGVAHRADFDLRQHQDFAGTKLEYFDQDAQVRAKEAGLDKDEINRLSKYMPHVIEPSAGLSRGVLALLCEAFTPTPERQGSKYVMKFHPRVAPIKAAVFPLVAKDGMPETAQKLYEQLRTRWPVQFDVKQSIGKRYARMDEAGTPYCFTIDGDTLEDQTVTVRARDDASQERVALDQVERYLADRIGG
jgi:glycyl-tRNA synthetase